MSTTNLSRPLGLASLLLLAAGLTASGQEPKAESEATAEIRTVMEQNCLMCHSQEMIVGQRLTPKQWAAEVDKMIGWGSPVPPDRKDALVAYLTATYPNTLPKPAPARITPDEALALDAPISLPAGVASPKGDIARGAAIYAQNCATCHGPEGKGGDLGTNLVEKPVLLREAEFAQLMRQGRRRMPGFAAVIKPEAEADVLAWLKARRGP